MSRMKIGIAGCTGRVGTLLISELQSGTHEGLTLSGGSMRDTPENSPDFFTTTNPHELFEKSDAVIDFTCPTATLEHAKLAAELGKTLIVGTTGMNAEEEEHLHQAAEKTTIIYAANTSVGVTLLCALVEQAAARLAEDWDIEIFESHHKHKVDAPSGTALALGRAAATGRKVELNDVAEYTRHGITGARDSGKIGFSVARGGDIVGEHDVTFYAEGERLTLSHKATNRAIFAKGALRAAKWSKDQGNGLYSMKDVLEL